MAPGSKRGSKKRQSSSSGSNPTETAAAGQLEPGEAAEGSGKASSDQRQMQQPSIAEALAGLAKPSKCKSESKSDCSPLSNETPDHSGHTANQMMTTKPVLLTIDDEESDDPSADYCFSRSQNSDTMMDDNLSVDLHSISDTEKDSFIINKLLDSKSESKAARKPVKRAFPADLPPSLDKSRPEEKAQVSKRIDERLSPENRVKNPTTESDQISSVQQGPMIMDQDPDSNEARDAQPTSTTPGNDTETAEPARQT